MHSIVSWTNCYRDWVKSPRDATGLSRGVSRSRLQRVVADHSGMPRACPVEPHARSYQILARGDTDPRSKHDLFQDSYVLVIDDCRSSKREAPRGKPVASRIVCKLFFVAASVRLHGA